MVGGTAGLDERSDVMAAKAKPQQGRAYRSPRRAQQAAETRAVVLAAASDLFATRGWAATSMRDVAQAAGVSVETIYASHGNKVALLLAAVDAGVVGDLDAVALRERRDFTALAQGSFDERAAALARLATAIHTRTSGLFLALREAAAGDATLASRLAELEEARRANVAEALTLVAGRVVNEHERDGLWAIGSGAVFRLLTQDSGWSVERYETWLADTIVRHLRTDLEGQARDHEAGHACAPSTTTACCSPTPTRSRPPVVAGEHHSGPGEHQHGT